MTDTNDQMLGTMDKIEAHIEGKLHRAFSIFIFNSKGELLLQQRALEKYHSGGLWTNTCCSHPIPGELTIDAARRRLMEEMGMICELEYGFNFTYREEMNNGIIEHEFDHVFFGYSDAVPVPVASEVAAIKYMSMEALSLDLIENPANYTKWLEICFDQILEYYLQYTKL